MMTMIIRFNYLKEGLYLLFNYGKKEEPKGETIRGGRQL
jgi:hypothetical protein